MYTCRTSNECGLRILGRRLAEPATIFYTKIAPFQSKIDWQTYQEGCMEFNIGTIMVTFISVVETGFSIIRWSRKKVALIDSRLLRLDPLTSTDE